MEPLKLGYSPCPNDTFIFYALVHGLVHGAPRVREILEDVETLNRMALDAVLDVTKISFHAFAHLRHRYGLLRSGGALGRGCGPLVVARTPLRPEALRKARIAIPGRLTTAALLLRLYDPHLAEPAVLPFHEIMGAVRDGEADAGVIIHEGRFTYPRYGLVQVLDLGAWWESETGHPIPLGGILARRSLGAQRLRALEDALRASVRYAREHPAQVRGYIRTHAQEMDEEVVQRHIDLYVTPHTIDYGEDGEAAIRDLLMRARHAGIVPDSAGPLFVT